MLWFVKYVLIALLAVASPLSVSAIRPSRSLMTTTWDPIQQVGFVPKGDVQLLFGWNNAALQEHAYSLDFILESSGQATWDCLNERNEHILERKATNRHSTMIDFIARSNRNGQVTGFLLDGLSDKVQYVENGPKINSCPSGPWNLVPGSYETTEQSSGTNLQVCHETKCHPLTIELTS